MNRAALIPAGLSILLPSCASTVPLKQYTSAQVGSINRAVKGRIVSVRTVSVDRSTGVGGVAGAGVGAAAGASFGRNADGTIGGALIGAVVGGVIAASVERDASKETAYEYVVTTENGALVTLVQGAPALLVGSSIIILYASPARLIPDGTSVR